METLHPSHKSNTATSAQCLTTHSPLKATGGGTLLLVLLLPSRRCPKTGRDNTKDEDILDSFQVWTLTLILSYLLFNGKQLC